MLVRRYYLGHVGIQLDWPAPSLAKSRILSQAWSRNRDMAGTDSQTFIMLTRQTNSKYIVIVVKGSPIPITWYGWPAHPDHARQNTSNQHNPRQQSHHIVEVALLNPSQRNFSRYYNLLGGHADRKSIVLAPRHRLNQHPSGSSKEYLTITVSRLLAVRCLRGLTTNWSF